MKNKVNPFQVAFDQALLTAENAQRIEKQLTLALLEEAISRNFESPLLVPMVDNFEE